MENVQWESWGDEKAVGHGTGYYVPEGSIGADSRPEPATVVAFDLGMCEGQYAYRAIDWFFPNKGGTHNPKSYSNICTGDYVG